MKVFSILIMGALALGLWAAPAAEQPDLIIYAYDSFVSEWGPAGKIVPKFEEKYNVQVSIQSVGDAGQVLNRAILEKDNPQADIVLGIDNNLLSKALEENVLQPYRSPNLEAVPEELRFDDSHSVTPFDYGYFALIWDTAKLEKPPRSLEALTRPEYRKKIILEDPRTSSPGLGFLLWTIDVYGEDYLDYWQRLKDNLLTITEGWDTAYGLFTSGEAPLVLSYTTSPAYHAEHENSTRYQALLFEAGHYLQIEGMGIVRDCPHPELAQRFIDFTLTDTFQKEIPLTNWMYPVVESTTLPASFDYASKPSGSRSLDSSLIHENLERWLLAWTEVVSR